MDRTPVCLPVLRGSWGREPIPGTGDEVSCLQEVCVKVAPRAGGLRRDQGRERVLFRRKQEWGSLGFQGPSDWKGGARRENATVGGLAGKADTSEPRKAGLNLLLLICVFPAPGILPGT